MSQGGGRSVSHTARRAARNRGSAARAGLRVRRCSTVRRCSLSLQYKSCYSTVPYCKVPHRSWRGRSGPEERGLTGGVGIR